MRIKNLLWSLMLLCVFSVCVSGQENVLALRERAKLYEPLIASAAARHRLDPHFLWTIAYLESRFRPEAISYKNGKPCARGLMQFIPATARRYGVKDPHNSSESIEAAARYVRDLFERFGNRQDLVLAAYNAGEGAVEAFREGRRLILPNGKIINPRALRTGGIPPYMETLNYVARGKQIYEQVSREKLYIPAAQTTKGTPFRALDSHRQKTETSIYSLPNDLAREAKVNPPNSTKQSLYPN
jgi:membrane-bound lytic murein transglycosylase MltF